jgi:hypothetical protein
MLQYISYYWETNVLWLIVAPESSLFPAKIFVIFCCSCACNVNFCEVILLHTRDCHQYAEHRAIFDAAKVGIPTIGKQPYSLCLLYRYCSSYLNWSFKDRAVPVLSS